MKVTEETYLNEHGCRLCNPDDFDPCSFRSMERDHDGKQYRVIMAKRPGEDTMTEQSYQYPKDEWKENEARKHCEDLGGKLFEPA